MSESPQPFRADLTNCDREPIHLSGAIQPHGAMLVLRPGTLEILQTSDNSEAFLGVAPAQLLSMNVRAVLDDKCVSEMQALAQSAQVRTVNPVHAQATRTQKSFDAIVHRAPEGLIVELEPPSQSERFDGFYRRTREAIAKLQTSRTVLELAACAVEEVRGLSGFDRVMVYRFDPHDNGHVIAESKREELESYLDLHYPAADIPAQARRLYTINLLRTIVDVGYQPVAIRPAVSPQTGAPLDLSFAVLRSVSPIHVEYLKNIGIAASMSISLLVDGRLWGLVICHHYSPHFVSYDVRAACELFSQTLSWQVTAAERADRMERRALSDGHLRELLHELSESERLEQGLAAKPDLLLDLVSAQGATLSHGGATLRFGVTPEPAELDKLVAWLKTQVVGDKPVFQTDRLSALYPEARQLLDQAGGVLAVRLDMRGESWLCWFRPEVMRTVNWAGDPNKTLSLQDGNPRLSPRGSFALWKETVSGQSEPWAPWDEDLALDLAHAIGSIVFRRATALEKLNRELNDSSEALRLANVAKDEFVATMSHELRNPLNSMLGWLRILRSSDLDRDRRLHAVEVIDRNAQAQARLIEDLLDVSRIISGKMRLEMEVVNLLDIVARAVETAGPSAGAKSIRIRDTLDPAAAVIVGEAARLQQIVWNLITNAIKFTPKGGAIDVSLVRTGSSARLSVADSGEGIDPTFLPHVFDRFSQAQTGSARQHQGLGLGLAIVRHLVELHGGTVSATSEGKGRGATFTVSLPLSPVRGRIDEPEKLLAPACPPQLAGLRALILEDEPDARELLVTELARARISARAFPNAAEGLAGVREMKPDVIISDIGLPGTDGYAFMHAVRQLGEGEGGRTPAIALTAYATSQDRAKSLRAGFQAHLPKPVDPDELFALLLTVSGRG